MASTGWRELFDLRDDREVQRAIQTIERLDMVYDNFISGLRRDRQQYQQAIRSIVDNTEELNTVVKNLSPATDEGRQSLAAISKQADVNSQTYMQLTSRISELETQIKSLTTEQNNVRVASQDLNNINKEAIRLEARLGRLTGERAEENAELSEQIRQQRRVLRERARASLGLVSIYEEESRRLNELRREYRDVALTQGTTSDEAVRLQNEIQELNDRLVEVDGNAGQFQRNVGNYPDLLEDIGGASGVAVRGIRGLGAAFTSLIANPIVAVLAVVVSSIVALFAAFRRTAAGAELFARATGVVNGILSTLSLFADNIRVGLISLFEDPLGSLRRFGEFLLSQVINRFEALVDIVGLFGQALAQLFTGEFSALGDTVNELGDAFVQLGTGLDTDQQREFAQAIVATTTAVRDNVNAFADLAIAQRRVRIENRELERESARLQAREEELNEVRDDATRSFQEREAAAERARLVLERRAQTELQLAQNNLDLLNQEVELRRRNSEDAQDLLDQQLAAQVALIEAEGRLTVAIRQNERERSQLRQDRLERDLDILIDGLQNQFDINNRIIDDDRRVLAERRALFDETERLAQQSFDQQIATIQQFTEERIDANQLLQTSDAVVLNERIRALGLSEIIEGRLLEVIRDRRDILQDIAEANRDLNDAEADRINTLRESQQFELDRAAQQIRIQEELTGVTRQSISDRLNAEVQAEQFRRDTLLQEAQNEIADLELLELEKQMIRQESEDSITALQAQAAQERREVLLNEIDTYFRFARDVGQILSGFTERANQRTQEQLEQLEEQQERELELAGNNANARAEIEERFQRRRESLEDQQRRRQRRFAIVEKALAVSQSIINGISAVSAALAPPPLGLGPVAGIPLAIRTGIEAALRTGAIVAQPIPAFWQGTDYAPPGDKIVGEKGKELVVTPRGKMFLTGDKAELRRDIPEGSTILNNVITKSLLGPNPSLVHKNSSDVINSFLDSEKRQTAAMQASIINKSNGQMLSKLGSVLDGMEVHQWHLKRGDLSRTVRKGNNVVKDWDQVNSYGK